MNQTKKIFRDDEDFFQASKTILGSGDLIFYQQIPGILRYIAVAQFLLPPSL